MMENHDYLGIERDPTAQLKAQVLMLQLRGAGYAAAFCIVAALSIWALYGIGLLLPDEAREADDPTPFSYVLPADAVERV